MTLDVRSGYLRLVDATGNLTIAASNTSSKWFRYGGRFSDVGVAPWERAVATLMR
jgi:hypothetical protein